MSPKNVKKSSRNKQPENLKDFLNQPVGFNSIMDILRQDISSFGNKKGELAVLPNLDDQADQLIERAANMAERLGISVEDALSQLGLDMGDESADESNQSDMKSSMLKSLDWEVTKSDQFETATETGQQWVRRGSEIIDELLEYFDGLDRELLVDILDKIRPESNLLIARLCFLKFCTKEEFQFAINRHQTMGGSFWRVLLSDNNSDLELFGEALMASQNATVFINTKGAFHEWLIDKGYMNYRSFKDVRLLANKQGVSIREILRGDDYLGKVKILALLSEFSAVSIWKAALPRASKKLATAINQEWIINFNIVPLKIKGKILTLATSVPPTKFIKAYLEAETKMKIEFKLLERDKIQTVKQRLLDKTETTDTKSPDQAENNPKNRIKDIVTSASAVNMVRQLFEGALESRATDIHIDPVDGGSRIRFRIDGLLYEVMKMDVELSIEVASRVKILADLDITEKRRPQDGHITINIHDEEYDMRISTVPTKYGERIGIRMVYAGNVMKSMDNLGLIAKDYQKVQSFIGQPHGMILATGPVGSGKTTTLYSCLNEIDRSIHNVMSIEDPVEFGLPGANQVEVNYSLQFGFVEGLRALLRQDPDTILIGEIRDEETARIAIRASMTGLLVFSTLHTNDAPGAITALQNFHLPTHLIANSIVGVIAQRLLRTTCTKCKKTYKPKKGELASLGFKPAQISKIKTVSRGKGCSHCFHSGYFGRTGVFEVFEVTSVLRDQIMDGASEKVLREIAIKEGMRTLAIDGRDKIVNGQISSEEFLRILRP